MFGRVERKSRKMIMTDECDKKQNEQLDGKACEEIAEKLDKCGVDEVAGGAGKQSPYKPPELPEIL